MTKKKTQKQIDAEIAALEKIKPLIRQTSAFGDNHHDAIDAQIRVLKEGISEDAAYLLYPHEDGDDLCEDNVALNVQEEAVNAARWMEGTLTDSRGLAADWESLRTDK